MLEWLKRHAWKACKRQNRFPSSNLGRSAINPLKISKLNLIVGGFCYMYSPLATLLYRASFLIFSGCILLYLVIGE